MNVDFLAWYDEKYPESNWNIETSFEYSSWLKFLDRDEHQRMLYDAWMASLGTAHKNGWIKK